MAVQLLALRRRPASNREKGKLECQITAGGSYQGFGEMRFDCVSTGDLSDPIKRPVGVRQWAGRAEFPSS